MKITFIDRVKKLFYQIDYNLNEEKPDYDLIELNLQVLENLISERQQDAQIHKDYLLKNINYFKQNLYMIKSIKEILNSILQQPPLQ
jgi:hypothetical protein